MTAKVPSDRNRKARLGSANSCSSRRNSPKSCSTRVAPAVRTVTVLPEATLTLRPSSCSSSSARLATSRSTASSRMASSAVTARPLRTVSMANRVLRPRWAATVSAKAAASLITLSEISPPCRATGVAAPMVVPGAIAARLAAKVISAPAEAARAPEERLDDLPHGGVQSAGGVQLDQVGGVPVALGLLGAVHQVVGDHRGDGPVDVGEKHSWPLRPR